MRVVFVNLEFPPHVGSGVWRVLGFARHLAEEGHDVAVVCSTRPGRQARRDDRLAAALPAGVRVERVRPLLLSDVYGAAERLAARLPRGGERVRAWIARARARRPDSFLGWALAAGLRARRTAWRCRADWVVSSGPPHLSHLAGWLAARASGAGWCMDYRDLWTDDPTHAAQGGLRGRVVRALESWLLRRADAVVTVSPTWLAMLRERLPADRAHRLHLVRNGHELEAAPAEAIARAGRADGRLRIHFNGILQANNHGTAFLDALHALRRELSAERMPAVTYSGIPEWLRHEVEARALGEVVRDVGFMRRERSQAVSRTCDVLLLPVNRGTRVQDGVIPAKTYDYIGLGRHVLALVPGGSDVRPLLDEYGDATVCSPDDVAGITRALGALVRAHRSRSGPFAPFAPRSAPARYSRRAQARELAALLRAHSRPRATRPGPATSPLPRRSG